MQIKEMMVEMQLFKSCCCISSIYIWYLFIFDRNVLAWFIKAAECYSQLEGNCLRCRKKCTLIGEDTNFNWTSLFSSVYNCTTNAGTIWLTVAFRNNVTVSLNKVPNSTYS